MTGRHRGFTVHAPNAAPVSYPSRRQARAVARQVRGAHVTGGAPCLLTLLLLPIVVLAARWHR